MNEAQENALTWMTVKCSAKKLILFFGEDKDEHRQTTNLQIRLSGLTFAELSELHCRTSCKAGRLNSEFVCILRAFYHAFAILYSQFSKKRRESNMKETAAINFLRKHYFWDTVQWSMNINMALCKVTFNFLLMHKPKSSS